MCTQKEKPIEKRIPYNISVTKDFDACTAKKKPHATLFDYKECESHHVYSFKPTINFSINSAKCLVQLLNYVKPNVYNNCIRL